MKNLKKTLACLMLICLLANLVLVTPAQATAASDAQTIVLSSTENADGSYSHTALYNGTAVTEYDYTWHADPSTVHTDVSNSPAEYYTGTQPGSDAVYIAHDIYYYPELPTSGFTRMSYDGEQEWCYYYTAEGYTSYIFSTLPGQSSLPTSMMHSADEAYQNAVLHITQPGDYIIEGTWHGQIWVDLENYCDDPFTDPTAKVNLILNGVTVNCTVAAGVVFHNVYECDNTWEDKSSWSYHVDTSAAGAMVTLADGTENNVTGCNIFRILKTQYKSGSTSVQKKRLKIDGAFYSYQSMIIQGQERGTGVLNITSGYEGLNSELHLTVNSGNVNIFSQDDGINVNEDNVSVLTINGGTLHILAGLGSEGDGIDSNGFISVNGGTVITMANPGADSGMDSDFGTYVFGGNVVAMGSTMDWVENDTSVVYDQATMNLQFSSSRSAGDAVVVTDTSGNGVFAYDPDKDEINGSTVRTYTGAIVSSENFEIGQSYYVYIGGEITGTESKGVYDMTTVTAVSSTYQQSYGSTSSSGGSGRPSMGGSSSGSSSGSGGTTAFALSNNVSKFSGVANYSSATSITVTPMEGTGEICDHVYNAEVTTEATCTTNGLMTYTCTLCGDSYTVNITASGHSYADGACTVCGAADPNYVSAYYLVGYINGANYGCEEDYENMGDYRFTDGKLTATFTADSYVFLKSEGNTAWYMAQSYCTDTTCTFYNTDTGAAEKLFVPGNAELTFTLTENTDGSLTLSYTAASAECSHSYTSKVTAAATCTTAGVKTYTCSKCGDSYTEAIAPIGHSYTSRVTTSATCTTDGVKTYTCSNCADSYTETIAATGHEYVGGTCANCGASDPNGTVTDGSYVLVTSLSDITAGGQFVIVANNSGTYMAMDTTLSSGKTAGVQVTVTGNLVTGTSLPVWTVAAVDGGISLSANGSYLKYNSSSNFTTADQAYTWTVAAGDSGYTVTASNSNRCIYYRTNNSVFGPYSSFSSIFGGYITELQFYKYVAAAQDCTHSYTSEVTTPATCTTDGIKTYTCADCGDSYTESIAAIGHSYTESITDATCTTDGIKTYTCANCTDSYTESIAATGHSYTDGTCTVCAAVDPDYVAPVTTYYLVGYINGANYGCEEDYESMGQYKFVDGQLTATFTADSYVFIKTEGNGKWYLTQSYCTDTTGIFLEGGTEKMFIPGNVEVTFTLTENTDGTLTLSYETASTECAHSYSGAVTTAATCTTDGIKTYTCSNCGDSYTEAIPAIGHSFVDGTCINCGASDPDYAPTSTTYYLVGYINGANYGCEEDYENMGEYKFVNGKLTATFTADSYVFLKTEGNGKWLLADSYCTDTTCTFFEDKSEKMFVPGNVEITFTLTENADGSVTLSYTTSAAEPSVVPTLTLKYPTVSFEDVIVMNVYYTAENLEDVVEMGLITYSSNVSEWNVGNAEGVIPGYSYASDKQMYVSSTKGIAGKNLGDTLYFAVYAKLADGTYTYTKLVSYSPETYAYSQLSTGTAEVKALVVAMLKYGAAAQTFFGHNTDALVDRNLTADQLALIEEYRADMMTSVATPSTAKQGAFVATGGHVSRYPTVSFEGAFSINYYYTPSYQPVDGITMYYWNQADYDAAEVLTAANCTGAIKMAGSGTSRYEAAVEDIAAKDLDKGIYVAFVYSDGTTSYASGVLSYSIGTYCTTSAAGTGAVAPLAAATAVYGYYAKQTFY